MAPQKTLRIIVAGLLALAVTTQSQAAYRAVVVEVLNGTTVQSRASALPVGTADANDGTTTLVLATAKHVVSRAGFGTRMQLRMPGWSNRPIPVSAGPPLDTSEDLAALVVEDLGRWGLDAEAFRPEIDALSPSDGGERDTVTLAGLSRSPLAPESCLDDSGVATVSGNRVQVNGLCTTPGDSGGALIGSQGNVVGMYIGAGVRQTGIPLATLREVFHRGGYPFGSATAAAGTLPDGGARTPWLILTISEFGLLPHIPDGPGGGYPDYRLLVSLYDGEDGARYLKDTLHVDRLQRVDSLPMVIRSDLDRIDLQIIDSDWFGQNEIITERSAPFGIRRAERGTVVRMEWTPETRTKIRTRTLAAEPSVEVRVSGVRFEPEAASGPDQNPAGATVVAFGQRHEDSVAILAADRTDHLRVLGSTGGCEMIVFHDHALQIDSEPAFAHRTDDDGDRLFNEQPIVARCHPTQLLRIVSDRDAGSPQKYAVSTGLRGSLYWLDAMLAWGYDDSDRLERYRRMFGTDGSTFVRALVDRMQAGNSNLEEPIYEWLRDAKAERLPLLEACCGATRFAAIMRALLLEPTAGRIDVELLCSLTRSRHSSLRYRAEHLLDEAFEQGLVDRPRRDWENPLCP